MKKTIEISSELYDELEAVRKKVNAASTPEQFTEEVVRAGLTDRTSAVYKPHDEEEMKQRLQSLGYID